VRARRTVLASKAIYAYLKGSKFKLEAKIQACDWFRRLGSFWEAYQVIAPEEYKVGSARLDRALSRQYLWTARMLNLLGATSYAVEVAEQIKSLNTAIDCQILANIYLSNFNSEKALPYFLKMEELEQAPESYSAKLGRLGTADALMGVGRSTEALKHLRSIRTKEDEQLLRGILLQSEGEYLARIKKYKEALSLLEKAKTYFSNDDQTVDYAFVLKWIAVAQAGLGQTQDASKIFNEAISVLKKPKHRPESWLDCYYWMDHFDLLPTARKKNYFAYPGLSEGFLKRVQLPPVFLVGNASAEIWISIPANEWRYGTQYSSSISKEIQLLGLLVRAGNEGISAFRILPELWPGEFAIHMLTRRLDQLKRELEKKFGVSITVSEQVLTLSEKDQKRVGLELWNNRAAPSVFGARTQVSIDEIQNHYQIKRTQCHHLVRDWETRDLVVSVKRGRTVEITLKRSRPD